MMELEIEMGLVDEIGEFGTEIPESPEDFCLELEVSVKERNKEGSEIFIFYICTTEWLSKNNPDELLFLKGFVLVPYFNHKIIKQRVEKLIRSLNSDNWNQFGEKMSRYSHRESE